MRFAANPQYPKPDASLVYSRNGEQTRGRRQAGRQGCVTESAAVALQSTGPKPGGPGAPEASTESKHVPARSGSRSRRSPSLSETGDGRLRGGGRRDPIEDFIVLGEPTDFALVPDLRAVDVNVKHAAGALDHLGVHPELTLNRLRQTGGRRVVVSFHAVLDADVHDNSSPPCRKHLHRHRRCARLATPDSPS